MRPRRAIIGTAIGAVILSLGAASFVANLGLREFAIDETYAPGEIILPYDLTAPEGTVQSLTITAESFDIAMSTPERGEERFSHEGSHDMEWVHGPSGRSVLEIDGDGEVTVRGTLRAETDWIFIAYDAFVMISGLIIMGFSAGFGKRRPRGF